MGPTLLAVAFPMPLEGIMHTTSMLANLFEKSDWFGKLSLISNWNDPLAITEDLLKFLVVSCELSDFSVLALGETDLDTL